MPPPPRLSAAKHLLLLRRRARNLSPLVPLLSSNNTIAKPSLPPPLSPRRRLFCSAGGLSHLRVLINLLTEDLIPEISALADALLAAGESDASAVLRSRSAAVLLRRSPNGFASVELLSRLWPRPLLALQVFNWRRQELADLPVVAEEYAKAISISGHANDTDLATELFSAARSALGHQPGVGVRIYNALMSAYMYNGLIKRSLAVFDDLKRDPDCTPNIVSYNILLSIFGRSMLIQHMEAVLETVEASDTLSPNLNTYNTVISAYLTAWMWDKMEGTFLSMESGPVKPDDKTHLLMLRGYANAGHLDKMEKMYELVKDQVDLKETNLIRAMVCTYCKSSDPNRIKKIEGLMKLIPEEEYRPWLNVLLIRVYAQEGLVEMMDRFITEAFYRNTVVTTSGIMRSVLTGYFQCDAVDRLANFVTQAELSGWKMCRSLYHCKMVMYGKQNRLEEMHRVLNEMEASKFYRTKKTFLIMYKAYAKLGRRSELKTIVGTMWKHGFVALEDPVFYNSMSLEDAFSKF